jgi:hypothetical protein
MGLWPKVDGGNDFLLMGRTEMVDFWGEVDGGGEVHGSGLRAAVHAGDAGGGHGKARLPGDGPPGNPRDSMQGFHWHSADSPCKQAGMTVLLIASRIIARLHQGRPTGFVRSHSLSFLQGKANRSA